MDLDLDLDSIFNGFGSGFGFKCVLGLDWILDLKKFMDLDLDLDLFLDMDSNPNPRIQIRTSLVDISTGHLDPIFFYSLILTTIFQRNNAMLALLEGLKLVQCLPLLKGFL